MVEIRRGIRSPEETEPVRFILLASAKRSLERIAHQEGIALSELLREIVDDWMERRQKKAGA